MIKFVTRIFYHCSGWKSLQVKWSYWMNSNTCSRKDSGCQAGLMPVLCEHRRKAAPDRQSATLSVVWDPGHNGQLLCFQKRQHCIWSGCWSGEKATLKATGRFLDKPHASTCTESLPLIHEADIYTAGLQSLPESYRFAQREDLIYQMTADICRGALKIHTRSPRPPVQLYCFSVCLQLKPNSNLCVCVCVQVRSVWHMWSLMSTISILSSLMLHLISLHVGHVKLLVSYR